MTELLRFLIHYLDFLYLDPDVRFADSKSSGSATADAWLVLEGPRVKWQLANDRGQVTLSVTRNAASPHFYRVGVVEQFLDGGPERIPSGLTPEQSEWLRTNRSRVEELFEDEATAERSGAALKDLMKQNAIARGYNPPSVRGG